MEIAEVGTSTSLYKAHQKHPTFLLVRAAKSKNIFWTLSSSTSFSVCNRLQATNGCTGRMHSRQLTSALQRRSPLKQRGTRIADVNSLHARDARQHCWNKPKWQQPLHVHYKTRQSRGTHTLCTSQKSTSGFFLGCGVFEVGDCCWYSLCGAKNLP